MLVDTSIWIDHFARGNVRLAALIQANAAQMHIFIIGELAAGNLPNRIEVLARLAQLPRVAVLTHDEVMHMLEARRLMGRGLGWIDLHLLASARASNIPLWTRDKTLSAAAAALGIDGSTDV